MKKKNSNIMLELILPVTAYLEDLAESTEIEKSIFSAKFVMNHRWP